MRWLLGPLEMAVGAVVAVAAFSLLLWSFLGLHQAGTIGHLPVFVGVTVTVGLMMFIAVLILAIGLRTVIVGAIADTRNA